MRVIPTAWTQHNSMIFISCSARLCQQQTYPLTTTTMSGDSNIGAWIQFAKLTAAAGEMTPFPYIKGVAGCIASILQVIEVRAVKRCCMILSGGLVSRQEQRGPSGTFRTWQRASERQCESSRKPLKRMVIWARHVFAVYARTFRSELTCSDRWNPLTSVQIPGGFNYRTKRHSTQVEVQKHYPILDNEESFRCHWRIQAASEQHQDGLPCMCSGLLRTIICIDCRSFQGSSYYRRKARNVWDAGYTEHYRHPSHGDSTVAHHIDCQVSRSLHPRRDTFLGRYPEGTCSPDLWEASGYEGIL